MTYRLSLLDKSPIRTGETATDALQQTLRLARHAEELGYHRFWVAEHHNSRDLACSAPEVVIAWILAQTRRIRVGSGGIMLQHYSPYKVAEVFHVLAALAPGRLDIGVGKTPGGLPLATAALQAGRDPRSRPAFADQFKALTAYLQATGPEAANGPELAATPLPSTAPDRFLLGASVGSAALAAAHGWGYVHAGHLNGDPDNLRASLQAYRKDSGRSPVLALSAYATVDPAEAADRVAELKVFRVFLSDGSAFNLARRDQAEEFARQAGDDGYRIEERKPNILAGTPQAIHAELAQLSRTHGIEEFIIEPPPVTASERLTSIELLARHSVSVAA